MIFSFVTYFDTDRLSVDFLHEGDAAKAGNWEYRSSALSVVVAGVVIAQFE